MQATTAKVDPSVRITLEGLVSARWVLLLIVVAIGVAGRFVSSLEAYTIDWADERQTAVAIIATVLIWGGSNWATSKWITRLAALGRLAAGLHIAVDIIALAVLIGLSGGASNPFTVLFVVPITLATQVGPRWTWGAAIASVVAFGVLLELVPSEMAGHAHHMGADTSSYSDHLLGMWLSLGLAGGLITFFVHRIAIGIAEQRRELSELRDTIRQERELASIGSLAAGAAHELGTPLATLSVLAGELMHMEPDEQGAAVKTMRGEIARCKGIIGSMASPELRAEALSLRDIEPWSISEIGEEVEVANAEWEGGSKPIQFVPKQLVASIVREIVANACTASSPKEDRNCNKVELRGIRDDAGLTIIVSDTGHGMSEETLAAATNPFFTTKGRAENMGLGLFLVNSQLRAYGGKLVLDSALESGTKVVVTIPQKDLHERA